MLRMPRSWSRPATIPRPSRPWREAIRAYMNAVTVVLEPRLKK